MQCEIRVSFLQKGAKSPFEAEGRLVLGMILKRAECIFISSAEIMLLSYAECTELFCGLFKSQK